jgi:macrolide-specific efflux system membrane fusion protein
VGASLFEADSYTLEGRRSPSAVGTHSTRRSRGTSGQDRQGQGRAATGPQRVLGLLLVAGCVLGAGWYVKQVVEADHATLTGTVISSGVLELNFGAAGQVQGVDVHVGEQVRRGQLLAVEVAPSARLIVSADVSAVRADRARVADLSAGGAPADIAQARSQLAHDLAQLARDRAALTATRIVAPAAGTVIAVDAQPGVTATSTGVVEYAGPATTKEVNAGPSFSLLPEQPQSTAQQAGSAALPAIELRTSAAWRVVALIPENSASRVRTGQDVTVGIPSAGLSNLRGRVIELLDAPVQTANGPSYQAVVVITGRPADPPLAGMSANVTLSAAGG